MEMDEELAEQVWKADRTAKEIDGLLEEVAWRLEALAKSVPSAADLPAYVAYRSTLEDLRYRQVSLRIDKAMALISRDGARTKSVRRNLDRLRVQIPQLIDDDMERREAAQINEARG